MLRTKFRIFPGGLKEKPKLENRNPNENRSPKPETLACAFGPFGYRISFGFRASDLLPTTRFVLPGEPVCYPLGE